MISMGTIQQDQNKRWRGRIACALMRTNFTFDNARADASHTPSPNAPDFKIIDETGIHIGNAWLKNNAGSGDFFSITFDGPHLDKPFYVTAFARGSGIFEMIWSRPRGEKIQDAA